MLNRVLKLGVMVIGTVLIAACSTTVKLPADDTDSIIPADEQIRPDATTSAAIKRLIENARQASKQGQMSRAESFLERAIRIEPKNPFLWHYLAKLHLYQGHYQRAEGLASKSTSLMQNSQRSRLHADNWRIIAHARQYQGDTVGAQRAQDEASSLSSGNH